MNDIRAALSDAMNAARGEDVMVGVKNIVVTEIENVDPDIDIRTTDYFNHSFAPDIVLSWKEAGKSISRDVFLRYSFRSAQLGRDVPALADLGPIVLALQDNVDKQILRDMRQDVEGAPRLLLTNVPALDDIVDESDTGRISSNYRPALPLIGLFRSNIMRGGRGLLASDTATRIREQIRSSADTNDELRNIDTFAAIVDNLFLSDSAARLTRASQLLRMGLSGEISLLDDPGFNDDPDDYVGTVIRGRLSDAELQVLVPYLLRRPDVTTDPAFWAHIGSMMSLERLESMWAHFSNLDLTPLAKANLDSWTARRAAVSINADAIDSDWGMGDESWHIHARMLCLVIGGWRLHLSLDGRKTRGRSNENPPARWADIQSALSEYPISSVTLQGIARKLGISAENSTDVYNDIATITGAVADNYYVPSLVMRSSDMDDAPAVEVDFRKMIATADAPVAVRNLGRLALKVLGYRNPTEFADSDII